MYLQFAPKMNDICAVKRIFPFALENIVNLVIYSRKVISVRERAVGTRRPVKVQY